MAPRPGHCLTLNQQQNEAMGGGIAQKLYTPARTPPRNPYPQWHKFHKTLPLVAQNLGWNPYPYWHKSTKKNTKKWFIGTNVGALAQKLEKPYPLWHTFDVQNPTLTGTLLENPTLSGTEICQNGTLAFLAYTYCRQWECPPPPRMKHILRNI